MAGKCRNKNLLKEEKLGPGEESLSINMGSMVTVAFAPAGDGAVFGLAEDPLALLVAAGAESSTRAEQGGEEDEVRGAERLTPSPPIYHGRGRRLRINCAHDLRILR